jgi:hypothetical protein
MSILRGLLLLLAIFASPSLAQRNLVVEKVAQEVRVALVIGNGAYKEAPLANPVNDAVDIAKALHKAGFKVVLKRDLGTRELRQAIRDFGDELRRAHVGLFYFAGHGVQVRGNNYLIPVGADIRTEADAEDLAIDTNYALRTMEESQVKMSIVILDACRNNPFARTFRSASRGLAQMTAATGTLIAFSTAPGSVAADGTGRNGVYTKHLLASLEHADTDILRVLQRTRAAVVKETRGTQTPWESTSLIGEFYFRPGALLPAASTQVQATGSGSDGTAIELVFWESIKASTNVQDFKAYLEQYPNGRFAALARNRINLQAPVSVAAVVPSTGSMAPQYPNRPVTLLVPFTPSHEAGVIARKVAPQLKASTNMEFIVMYMPGANGLIGTNHALTRPADGYTVLVTSLDAYKAHSQEKASGQVIAIDDTRGVAVAVPPGTAEDIANKIKLLWENATSLAR